MKYLLILTLMMPIFGCAPKGSEGTSTGNPVVDLKIDSYNSTLAVQKTSNDLSAMAMSSLKFCFKRLRFKTVGEVTNPDPSSDLDNVDYYLGEVTISSLGTNLSGVNLPAGTYSRVEFDLDDDCPSGKSIQLTNSNGSFSTDDRITIKFEGNFTHTSLGETLNLNIQQIISKLNTVTSSSQIRSKAESVSGSF